MGQNSFSSHIFSKYVFILSYHFFFHSRSRSRVFLGMIASDSHSRIVGMDFFHSLPVPELWEWIFFIPFPFPNFGNRFFHSLPIPEFWEWFFFHSLPVPELREWVFSIPFPFPNFGNGIIHYRSRSRTPKCHSRSGLTCSFPSQVLRLHSALSSDASAAHCLMQQHPVAQRPRAVFFEFCAYDASHNMW